jgi:hypothetical protein
MEGSGMYTVDGISLVLFFQLNSLPPGSRFHWVKGVYSPTGEVIVSLECMFKMMVDRCVNL